MPNIKEGGSNDYMRGEMAIQGVKVKGKVGSTFNVFFCYHEQKQRVVMDKVSGRESEEGREWGGWWFLSFFVGVPIECPVFRDECSLEDSPRRKRIRHFVSLIPSRI